MEILDSSLSLCIYSRNFSCTLVYMFICFIPLIFVGMAFVVTCSVVPIHVFLHLTFGCLILSFIHNESFDVVYANHIEYVVCSLSFPKCLHFLSLPFIPFPFLCYGVFPASLK